jgi:hypothetical protein
MTSKTDCAANADYEWLVSSQAAKILDDLPHREETVLKAASRLRKQLSPARVHLVLEQVELRKRAVAKFPFADRMFFQATWLEQATDAWTADYKALRFANRGHVADLCCGIGGDLLSLAARGSVVGVDRDEIAACLAAANARTALAASVADRVSLRVDAAESFDVGDYAAWHLDPDRRRVGKRTSAPEWSSPKLETVERLLESSPHAAIKLAPAASVPTSWIELTEQEWISRDRQCRQLVAWHGELARRPGECRATVLAADGTVMGSVFGQPDVPIPIAARLGGYLYEPDSAVLAAHLTGVIARQHGLLRVSAGVAYLTTDQAVRDPLLVCFEIEDQLPIEKGRLATYFRERGIGILEIKKRRVDIDPEKLRRELKLRGDRSATLVLMPCNGRQIAVVARRCDPGSGGAFTPTSIPSRPTDNTHAACL